MIKQKFVFRTLLGLVISFAIVLGMSQNAAAVLIPVTGYELPAMKEEAAIPSLQDFMGALTTGDAGELVGVYVDETFAYPVVQQPAGSPAFVSATEDVVTQFSMAEQYGSTGLLAHNYLAGANFGQLKESQAVELVFGDGSIQNYRITEIRIFQATSPYSPYSDFKDVDSQEVLSSTDLFMQTYALEGVLIFQTCLEKDGIDSWGRIFVIAEPVEKSILDLS